jgi:hypothetical protein
MSCFVVSDGENVQLQVTVTQYITARSIGEKDASSLEYIRSLTSHHVAPADLSSRVTMALEPNDETQFFAARVLLGPRLIGEAYVPTFYKTRANPNSLRELRCVLDVYMDSFVAYER